MKDKITLHLKQFELYYAISFFFLGIIFDIFTLGRPDEIFNLAQQFLYLSLLSWLFYLDLKARFDPTSKLTDLKWWQYHELLAHFLYGSLLSAFTLFFLKSSSFLNSFVFLVLMMGLLVVNELPRFQQIGPRARALLLTLCWFCYLLLVIPIIISFVGWFSFILSLLILIGMLFLFQKKLVLWLPKDILKKDVIYPSGLMMAVFTLFYILQIIPPVPLHLEKIGIFHGLEKKDGQYIGKSYSDDCSHWFRSSNSHFHFESGDEIVLIFSLFAPSRMEDEVKIHWRVKENGSWRSSDKIPVGIKGGRSEGYRGFSIKKSIHPGDWEVRVETTDGRVIGNLHFEIINEVHGQETRSIF